MPLDTPLTTRDIAHRLLAMTGASASDELQHPVTIITGQLRVTLTKFAGSDSFSSLLRRALVLASAEAPVLTRVTVGPDGRLEGLAALTGQASGIADNAAHDAAIALTTHLLSLLATFIGLPFTLRLVRDAWPALSLAPNQSGTEDEA